MIGKNRLELAHRKKCSSKLVLVRFDICTHFKSKSVLFSFTLQHIGLFKPKCGALIYQRTVNCAKNAKGANLYLGAAF